MNPYKLIAILGLLSTNVLFSQNCDLNFENFNTSTNANPPSGWIKGPGTDIGVPTVGDMSLGVAVGFNTVSEYIISKKYTCGDTICFKWRASGTSSNFDVVVSYSLGDTSVWYPINTIVTTGSSSPTAWQNLCVNLPEGNLIYPFDIRVRWQMTRRVGGTFYMDNVCANGGTCVVNPSKFTFTSIPSSCKLSNTPVNVAICATDGNGNIAETYNDNISVSVFSGPSSISGSISGNAVDGCFIPTINFNAAGTYVLTASSVDNPMTGISPAVNVVDVCPLFDSIRVISYNILNFPLGRDDCGAENTVVPARWDTLAKIVTFFKPDVLLVCELQNEWGADSILNRSFNTNGVDYYARAAFVTNSSTSSESYNNMLFYNTNKLTLHSQGIIPTSTRDFNKYVLYGNDPGLASHHDTTFIDFYMAHLKAGNTTNDSLRRAEDCLVLKEYLDANPERNSVLCGDLNFYSNAEGAYINLTTGLHPLQDPLGMNVLWEGNPAYAISHSQSSRAEVDPPYDCGIDGGCDSRFDFILVSQKIMNNVDSVKYLDNTYQNLGNNGSIFNKRVNDASNTSALPKVILNSLFYMSDHLPVKADLYFSYQSISGNCNLVQSANEFGINNLREVINCVSINDTVSFASSLSDSIIYVDTPVIEINKNLHIIASPEDSITISSIIPRSINLPHLFKINTGNTVLIEGVTLIGGFGPDGSAIENHGNLILKDVTILNGGHSPITSTVRNLDGGSVQFIGNCKVE